MLRLISAARPLVAKPMMSVRFGNTSNVRGFAVAKASKPLEKKAPASATPAAVVKPKKVEATKSAAAPAKPAATKAKSEKETVAAIPKVVKAEPKEAVKSTRKTLEKTERRVGAYALYVRKFFEDNKKSSAPLAFQDVVKNAASSWKSLTEESKKPFSTQIVMSTKRKRTLGALDLFRSERLKETGPNPEAFKNVSKEWKILPEEQKAKYRALTATPKGRARGSAHKKSSWQVFLTTFMQRYSGDKNFTRDKFKTAVKQASADFKKLSDDEKKKLAA